MVQALWVDILGMIIYGASNRSIVLHSVSTLSRILTRDGPGHIPSGPLHNSNLKSKGSQVL